MNSYPTLMEPEKGSLFVMALNVLILGLAFFAAAKFGKFSWLFHVLAFLSILASPILLAFLVLPEIPPEEAPGPGDGFILMPLLGEVVLLGALYLVYFIVKSFQFLVARNQKAKL